ncbi:hypothetical protein V12B01_12640 [Vibrio splendidus 12B01]|nr:hypothetical protein V12B01_12640 [Vibrio splendidus 12B01]
MVFHLKHQYSGFIKRALCISSSR